jgi:hypothetical protein
MIQLCYGSFPASEHGCSRRLARLRRVGRVFLQNFRLLDGLKTPVAPDLRASTLVWSDMLFHAFTCNLGSTQQTTYTMSCLVSRLVDLYNSLICAHKKGIL